MDVHIALLMSDSGSDSGSNRQPEAVYGTEIYFASARPASDSRLSDHLTKEYRKIETGPRPNSC